MKHAVKQVDRLMSNGGIDVWDSFVCWAPHQIGAQRDMLLATEWPDLDHDGQSTLSLSLVTRHGRGGGAALAERLEGGDRNQGQ